MAGRAVDVVGRAAEIARLERLADDARQGTSGALVLLGRGARRDRTPLRAAAGAGW